jgi:hypothetical protein
VAVRKILERLTAEPERIVFAVATAALAAAGAKRSKPAETVAKPLVMLSIQAGLWRTRNQRSAVDNALLAVGSTAAFAGDWLMMQEEFASTEAESDEWIKRGATAFAVNHAATIALALKLGARPRGEDLVKRLPGLIEGLGVLATRRRHLLMPLGSYSKLLTAMSTVVAAPELTESGESASLPGPLELGGLSFVVSDGTLLHRRVFLDDEQSRAIAEVGVLTTYATAQRLIFDGLDAASRRAKLRQ